VFNYTYQLESAKINLDNYPLFSYSEDDDNFEIHPLQYTTKKLTDDSLRERKQQWEDFLLSEQINKHRQSSVTPWSHDEECDILAYFISLHTPKIHMANTIKYLKNWSDLNTLHHQSSINCIDITLLFYQLAQHLLHLPVEMYFSSVHSYCKIPSTWNIIDLWRNTANKKRLFTPAEHSHEMIKNGLRPFLYIIKKTKRKIMNLFK
jgi:hypothetical protein